MRILFSFSSKCIVLLFLLVQLKFESSSINAAAATVDGGSERDRVALLHIKSKIVNHHQTIMSTWNDSLHFCKWDGVICGRRHKRVIILDLQSKNLVGSLSPFIGNMSFLRRIRLYNNSFEGEIPYEVGRLFRLKSLRLENNSFGGKIPTSLSNCTNLELFGLAYNKLVGNIPAELSTLSKLIGISIQNNSLSGIIPPFLGNFSFLEIFSVTYNFFSGSIPNSLGKLNYLSYFTVGGNNLSGVIPPGMYNISSIIEFSVAGNSLHGNLPSNIGLLLPNLQMLEMSFNHFSGSIPESLSNASKLEQLFLISNSFTGNVDINFAGLERLFRIQLRDNHLGGKGDNDLDFMTSLMNCSNLRWLDIYGNRFNGVLASSLPNQSSSIEFFSIGGNQIRGSLSTLLNTLVSSSTIGISFNQISGTIPVGIGKLSKVQVLYLDHNRISGPIPSSIGNLSLLLLLRLDYNNLQGIIPPSFGNLPNLLSCNLAFNNLSGSIPDQMFANNPVIVTLDLSDNYFAGSLPSEIGNSFNLYAFDISRNNFSGKIPYDLGKCNSLEYLYMYQNNLQGTIPSSLASSRGLREFDLSMNNLSGEIPEYLEGFALEYLNMSFNNFEGEVPVKGVFANASAISVEGNSMLCGGIAELKLPRCIVQVSNGRRIRRHVQIIAIVISCVCGIIMLTLCLYCRFKKKRKQTPDTLQIKSLQKISYGKILKATNGFASENLIGVGSSGSVYKGLLDDGTTVAIKVLNLQSRGASKSFKAECKALRNIRHRNLVKVITSCSSIDFQGNDFKALIYEFMPNGSLQDWLHTNSEMDVESTEHPRLTFLQRISIAIDIGNAIDYLHHNCEKPIIHCDLKPSNILLDNDKVAHVGDFGLAKFIPGFTNSTDSSSVGVRGTIGYTAPEYGMGSEVSASGDVYSYGILLLEIVTAKKPTDDIFVDGLDLHNLARMAILEQVSDIVDPILLQEDEAITNRNQGLAEASIDCRIECLISMMKVGIACSVGSPQDRMDITSAVNELISIKNTYLRAIPGPSGRTRI